MPEGHTIHAAARKHQRILVGNEVYVSSPQGRFQAEALKLNGTVCQTVEAYGKHLIYQFDNHLFLHIHLGLFGRIRLYEDPAADPRETVRVRLVSKSHAIDVSGPTICEIYSKAQVKRLISRIGPDPLRHDSNPEQVFTRISHSRTAIGKLLMDQSVISGIGNIYRTELLWRQSIHPNTPGKCLNRSQLRELWDDAVFLLEIGVKKNAIVTIKNPLIGNKRTKEKLNIFGKNLCPKCKNTVVQLSINGRKAFVCEKCQLLR